MYNDDDTNQTIQTDLSNFIVKPQSVIENI